MKSMHNRITTQQQEPFYGPYAQQDKESVNDLDIVVDCEPEPYKLKWFVIDVQVNRQGSHGK